MSPAASRGGPSRGEPALGGPAPGGRREIRATAEGDGRRATRATAGGDGRRGPTWIAALADLVVPLECAGCGEPGKQWCPRCAHSLSGPLLTVRTRADLPVPAWVLAGHTGAAARAVSAYKDRGRADLARPFASALAGGIDALRTAGEIPDSGERPLVLVPAPASGRARRRRGFDHMRDVVDALAAELAGSTPPDDVVVAPLLEVRGRVRDASGLGAGARADNLAGRIRRRPADTPLQTSRGVPTTVRELLSVRSTVLVVDDVVTTGATAAACVDGLRSGGLEVTGVLALTVA